jgi:hypothetical protein
VNDSSISVRRNVKRLLTNEERLLQLGQEDYPTDWRFRCGHQQAVIPAGIQPNDRGRRKSAQPVRFKPLSPQSSIQIAAGFLCELNHGLLQTAL